MKPPKSGVTVIFPPSLPSWERGLKRFYIILFSSGIMSLPSWERGLKRYLLVLLPEPSLVAPFVGAWIETKTEAAIKRQEAGRSLRGSVD